MRRQIAILLALSLALGVGACGGGTSEEGAAPEGPPPAPAAGTPAAGGGLSIEEALASTLAEPLLVKGFLVAPEGKEVRLCTELLKSYPPLCGGASLVVEGLDLASVEGLQRSDDGKVTWSLEPVSLLGSMSDGVLRVSATST